MNSLLGTISSLRSQLVIVVARMRIRETTPVDVADRDDVADADRPLEQDDDAGDEVGEDLLQPEAQADAHGGDEPLNLGPTDAQHPHRREQPDDRHHVACNGADRVAAPTSSGSRRGMAISKSPGMLRAAIRVMTTTTRAKIASARVTGRNWVNA